MRHPYLVGGRAHHDVDVLVFAVVIPGAWPEGPPVLYLRVDRFSRFDLARRRQVVDHPLVSARFPGVDLKPHEVQRGRGVQLAVA